MTNLTISKNVPCSFRDPSGFLFHKDNVIYRQINFLYTDNYDHLINSGFNKNLVRQKVNMETSRHRMGGYYEDTNYSSSVFESKKQLVNEALGRIRPKTF